MKQAGAWMVVAAAILWGTLGPTFQWLGEGGVTASQIGFWRALVAGGALMLWLALRDPARLRVARGDWPLLALYGLVSVALFFVVYPLAVARSTVAVAAVLLYTAPAWVALLAALFLDEPLSGRKGAAIALTFVGTALVAGAYDPAALRGNGWGIAAGLASGLTYATFSLFGKVALRRHRPTTVMAYALSLGALYLLPVVTRDGAALLAPLAAPRTLALLAYVGLVPTVGSMMLYTIGLQRLGDAGQASVIATIEPLVAALLGLWLLGEPLTAPQLAGGALILAGVLLLQGRAITRRAPPARRARAGRSARRR